MPGAAQSGEWLLGFDGSGDVYALQSGNAATTVYEVSPAGVLISSAAYPYLNGQASAVDADWSGLWIAGSSGTSAALWQASPSGLSLAALSPNAAAQAVLADGSGVVWMAGAGAETTLWRFDSFSGTMSRYQWSNTLGGSGSSGQALVKDTVGNVWIGGWAHSQAATVAALWKWNGSSITLVATSTGTFADKAQGLDMDAAGRLWLSGLTQIDPAGDSDLAVWQYQPGNGPTLSVTSLHPNFPQAASANWGNILTVANPNVYALGTKSDGSFTVWSQPLGLGAISGTLNYAGGFNGGSVYFYASNTPDFINATELGPLTAPNSGTSFNYDLTGLSAPATYYLAAFYDLTGYLAAGGSGPTSGNPAGVDLAAPVSLQGTAASAAPIAMALDQQAPSVAILAPVAGSTITAALFAVSGTASDNIMVDEVDVAVQDLTDGTWWDPYAGGFVALAAPLWSDGTSMTGPLDSVSWSDDDAPDIAAAMIPGNVYAVSAQALDGSGNVASSTVTVVIANPAAGESGAQAMARDHSGNFWTMNGDYSGGSPVSACKSTTRAESPRRPASAAGDGQRPLRHRFRLRGRRLVGGDLFQRRHSRLGGRQGVRLRDHAPGRRRLRGRQRRGLKRRYRGGRFGQRVGRGLGADRRFLPLDLWKFGPDASLAPGFPVFTSARAATSTPAWPRPSIRPATSGPRA